MEKIWQKFEDWLRSNWPDGLEDLNPPATDEEILELESVLGVSLPIDFVAFLKVHNGQGNMVGGIFDNSEFLSTSAIADQWKVWKELLDSGEFNSYKSAPQPGIKDDWCELGRVFRIPTTFSSRQLLLGDPGGVMLRRTAVA